MATRRSKSQRAPAASDYETDTDAAHLSSLPPPPRRTNDQLNLSVLRRFEPDVTSILSYASYSVLYIFQPDGQWEKCGIEGTLFVCALTPSPIGAERFTVIILNRRGLDNFITELKSPDNVDVTDEYIILQVAGKDGAPQIYGLWIFAEPPPSSTATARTMNANTICGCAERAESSRVAAEQQQGHQAMAQAEAAAEAVTEEHGADMDRSVSLTELFGQQREQDSDFTIHNHHENQSASEQATAQPAVQMPVPSAAGIMAAPANTGTPQFAPTPDNAFFLSGPRPAAQPPQVVNQAQAAQLLQLFQPPQAPQAQPQAYSGL
ncbi:uncharacterized protein K452DRAFT_286512 [Aplosporella prunicola CBS 121167]|uniref:PH domain-like protein n=1 Tax=Aplosporella prunicola CBS 121167 TaxID=1176127 RepID=A0A6A6BHG2_9PEZI|nr:uncharacterized protein K452DRAFT_286512 [Aplosporella prunicola CBS 121167]KAF2142883.1 hypothetical protein K452DRAFT_286512 [Aplosporella prunicola CBS 121167]